MAKKQAKTKDKPAGKNKSKVSRGGGGSATATTTAATYLEPAMAELKRRVLETGETVKDSSRRSSAHLGNALGREVHEHAAAAVVLTLAVVTLLLLMGCFRRGSRKSGITVEESNASAQQAAEATSPAAGTPAVERGAPCVDQQQAAYEALSPEVAEDLRAAAAAANTTTVPPASPAVTTARVLEDVQEEGASDMLAAVVGKVSVDVGGIDSAAGADSAASSSNADVAAAISAADDALADAALIMEESATAAATATTAGGTAVHAHFAEGDFGADGDSTATASRSLQGEIEAAVDGALVDPSDAAASAGDTREDVQEQVVKSLQVRRSIARDTC